MYPVIHLCEDLFGSFRFLIGSEEASVIAEKNMSKIEPILSRIDSLVIGPGAGRSPGMLLTMCAIIRYAREHSIPAVIDGDGLWAVTQHPELVMKCVLLSEVTSRNPKVILTPNQMEFTRLWNAVMSTSLSPSQLLGQEEPCYASQLASK